jgi:hypothetical protein
MAASMTFIFLALIVHFTGGAAVVDSAGGVQHVVIKDARGNVTSDSYCDRSAGSYDAIVRFGTAIVAAARSGDRNALLSLMQFPLRVNAHSDDRPAVTRTYASAAEVAANFDRVFSPGLKERMKRIEPHDVFCRDGLSSLDGGLLWATADGHGVVRATVINQ